MPLPEPKNGESRSDFISRCMIDKITRREFPDGEQRFAICNALWDQKKNEVVKGISAEYMLAFIKTAKELLDGEIYKEIHDRAFHIAGGKISRIQKAVVPFQNLPLAERDRSWNSDRAVDNIRRWAGGPEKEDIDWDRYRKGFIYYDAENPENYGSYSFPIADVINERLRAVPKAVFASAAVLQGARGGTDLSQVDQERMKNHLARYYDKMAEVFEDENIIPPWERVEQSKILKADKDKRLVYGVVLEPETEDAHGDVISNEEIERAAHFYMLNSQTVGDSHLKEAPAKVVQSYVTPVDFTLNNQFVKKGSWVLVTKILDENLWQDILNGEYTGYSVGGFAIREEGADSESLNIDEIISV